MQFDDYGSARHVRHKIIKKPLTGKQEQLAFDSGLYAPVAFASCKENEKIALDCRVLSEQLPAPDLLNCLAWINSNMEQLLPRVHQVRPVSMDDYFHRVGSSPSVVRKLKEAHQRLQLAGITSETTLTSAQIRTFTKRSAFVKVENLSYHSPLGLKEKAPRLIQGATPEFVVLVGPWIMALQDVVCRRLRPGNSNMVFTSGQSAEVIAECVTSVPGLSGFDDIATFDLDQSAPWGDAFVKWSKRWGAPVATRQLLKGNVHTHGSTHHGWNYKCLGTRKSGDPYTSLFNTLINLFSHMYIFCKNTGLTPRETVGRFVMVAQGDDNAFSHSGQDQIPWRRDMLALGFDSEATYCGLEELDFCSMRMYQTDQGWVFGPKPGRVLCRFGYAINRPANVTPAQYVRGVVKGQYQSGKFIPILKEFYDRLLLLTSEAEGKEYTARTYERHRLRVAREHTGIGIMYCLTANYYWCFDRQKKFRELLSTMQIGDVWPAWVQQLLLDRDTDGLKVTYSR